MAFVHCPALEEWNLWFGAWRHLATIAFICEDFPFWETHDKGITTSIICSANRFEHSPLTHFKTWLGVDRMELSHDFRLACTCIHQLGWTNRAYTAFGKESYYSRECDTGSITTFWVKQKGNIIVTLVEIMLTFCNKQNGIRIINLASLLHCCKCWTKVNFGQNLGSILSFESDKIPSKF